MTGYRDSSAYDFSLFEPQEPTSPERAARTATNTKARAASQKGQVSAKTAPQKRAATQTKTRGNTAVKTAAKAYATVDSYGKTVERNAYVALVSPAIKKVILFGAVCFMLMSCLLYMRAQSDRISAEIADVKSEIEIADGESVRLNATLASKISSQKIEDYAENVLGMVKAEGYQITYLDLSNGDETVVSGGKSAGEDTSFKAKVKELFAYIF